MKKIELRIKRDKHLTLHRGPKTCSTFCNKWHIVMQRPWVSECDWWAHLGHGTHTTRHYQSVRTFNLRRCQSAPRPHSFMPCWDNKDLPRNAVLHSEKRCDLLISPSVVGRCFLAPAVTAQLVGSYKQAGKVMPCRRWLDKGEQVQRPSHSHSSGAATVICRPGHRHRSPQGAFSF